MQPETPSRGPGSAMAGRPTHGNHEPMNVYCFKRLNLWQLAMQPWNTAFQGTGAMWESTCVFIRRLGFPGLEGPEALRV